ncbi:hypothetical protein CMUS01_16571 [Colletotrichum musicola]|nr:hypothetical protein CMUS01_16571 [Colletotrichum musicola]
MGWGDRWKDDKE